MLQVGQVILSVFFIAVFFLIGLYEKKLGSNLKKAVLALSFIFFSFMYALKDFGLDLKNYQDIFIELSANTLVSYQIIFQSKWEPLFVLAAKVAGNLGLGFQGFFFIWYFFPFLIIYRLGCLASPRPLLTISLYFLIMFFGFMDAARHFAAASYYILGIFLIAHYRGALGSLFFPISFFAHNASLISILYPLYKKFTPPPAVYLMFLLLCAFSAFMVTQALTFIINFYALDEMHVLFWKIDYYLNYYNSLGYLYQGALHKFLWFIMTYPYIIFIALLNLFFLRLKVKKMLPVFERRLLASQVVGTMLAIIFVLVGAPTMALRIIYMLGFGLPFLITRLWPISHGIPTNSFFLAIISFFIVMNIFYVFYLAGFHVTGSPLYLGF